MSDVVRIGDATLYLGDCMDILQTLERIDCVVIDPPYFLPAQSYVGTRKSGYPKRTLADTSILKSYFQLLFEQLSKLVGASGTYYIFCDAKSYPIFWETMLPYCKHVRLLIWDKIMSFNGYTWRHQHELIAWGECKDAVRVPTGEGDVIRERGVLQDDRFHPAQKPVALLQKLIAKHDYATILDSYMGSGTTGVACLKEGRKFIGIEIDPDYFKIACDRIEREYNQGKLF